MARPGNAFLLAGLVCGLAAAGLFDLSRCALRMRPLARWQDLIYYVAVFRRLRCPKATRDEILDYLANDSGEDASSRSHCAAHRGGESELARHLGTID